jgi:DNA-binding transcriptional MocR family regulator
MNWLDIVSLVSHDSPADDTQKRGDHLYLQIVRSIKDAILSGKLPIDSRLPTNRELASLLNIDRSTVSRAYLELSEAGLIESHVGRGTYVKSLVEVPKTGASNTQVSQSASHPLSANRPIVWTEKFSRASQTVNSIVSRQAPASGLQDNTISFGGGIPTEEFYPSTHFQRIVSEMVGRGDVDRMFAYSPAEGDAELRDEVIQYLSAQSMPVQHDELLIVSGSQQGIDLVSTALVDENDVVIIEDPSYFWAICNFRARHARLIGVPVDEEGMRMDVLETVLKRQKAKLIYVMPAFQNPTGATMSQARRQQLLALAREYQVPILEDNFVGELVYDGERRKPLRAEPGAQDIVIHQGTFSKALCPGLRLGWIVAPQEVMNRLRAAKRSSDLTTNSMAQVVLARYLQEGLYKEHLEHVRAAYKQRLETLVDALEKQIAPITFNLEGRHRGPQRMTWTVPCGGLFVWAKLPARLSAREFLNYAEREGVTFSPGELFFVGADQPEYLRLCFIQTDEDTIREGVKRLSKALAAFFSDVLRVRSKESTWSKRGNERVLI